MEKAAGIGLRAGWIWQVSASAAHGDYRVQVVLAI